MPINKRKKSDRMRAQTTHGWGAKKKHRGAGNRGGRGMAGSGKMADQKKPSILKEFGNTYFGRRGFKRPQSKIKKRNAINIDYIEKNSINKEGIFIFDASNYDKVLGNGNLTKKVKVTCKSFSKNAEEKITKIGGEAIVCP